MPGVLFDTSVWSGIDLLDLYRQVAPEQVVYASDYPYGRLPNSLLLAVQATARKLRRQAARVDAQEDTARRIVEGAELEPLSAPKARPRSCSL